MTDSCSAVALHYERRLDPFASTSTFMHQSKEQYFCSLPQGNFESRPIQRISKIRQDTSTSQSQAPHSTSAIKRVGEYDHL